MGVRRGRAQSEAARVRRLRLIDRRQSQSQSRPRPRPRPVVGAGVDCGGEGERGLPASCVWIHAVVFTP